MGKPKFMQALDKKSAFDKKVRDTKNEVINGIRKEAFFKIRLRGSMEAVDRYLDEENVESVIIQVDKEDLAEFNRIIFSDEMRFYRISSERNEEGLNLFRIAKKEVVF